MRLCIVIPAHNEGGQIGFLIDAIKKRNLDVVVIDDGSTDGSGAIVRDKGVVVLTHPSKRGKGLSLKEAFAYALQQGYDGVITMDGDGQHDPSDLDQFLEEIERHPRSIITGSRMADPKGMPPVRFLTNCIMSGLISLLCRRKIPDTQCGFRYIGADVLKGVHLTSNDFEIETEVLIKASRMGCPIFSLPIKTIYRGEKSKIRPLKDTRRFFVYIFKEMRGK